MTPRGLLKQCRLSHCDQTCTILDSKGATVSDLFYRLFPGADLSKMVLLLLTSPGTRSASMAAQIPPSEWPTRTRTMGLRHCESEIVLPELLLLLVRSLAFESREPLLDAVGEYSACWGSDRSLPLHSCDTAKSEESRPSRPLYSRKYLFRAVGLRTHNRKRKLCRN